MIKISLILMLLAFLAGCTHEPAKKVPHKVHNKFHHKTVTMKEK